MQKRSISINLFRDLVAARIQLLPAKGIELIFVGVVVILIVYYLTLYQAVIFEIDGEEAVPEDNVIQVRPMETAAEQRIENDTVGIKSNFYDMLCLRLQKDQENEDQTDPRYFGGHYNPANRGKSEEKPVG
jgi:hypothetical protein